MKKVISQMDAAAQGLNRYYTGKPCRRGHDSERYVSNGQCVQCLHEDNEERSRRIRELRQRAKDVPKKPQE